MVRFGPIWFCFVSVPDKCGSVSVFRKPFGSGHHSVAQGGSCEPELHGPVLHGPLVYLELLSACCFAEMLGGGHFRRRSNKIPTKRTQISPRRNTKHRNANADFPPMSRRILPISPSRFRGRKRATSTPTIVPNAEMQSQNADKAPCCKEARKQRSRYTCDVQLCWCACVCVCVCGCVFSGRIIVSHDIPWH